MNAQRYYLSAHDDKSAMVPDEIGAWVRIEDYSALLSQAVTLAEWVRVQREGVKDLSPTELIQLVRDAFAAADAILALGKESTERQTGQVVIAPSSQEDRTAGPAAPVGRKEQNGN